jgi:1-acyl-sn-glycerol-3-phosphate acyltransferase
MMRIPTIEYLQEAGEKLRPYTMRLYTGYIWLFVIPVMLLATLAHGLGCLVTVNFVGPRRAGRWFGTSWARLGLWLSGIKVHVEGTNNIVRNQSMVIVANHLSHVDIWVLYGYLPMDFRWVMKQELRQVPIIGICCEKLGHIFIDRNRHTAALASLEKAKQDIKDGTSVIFFPEGTRSRDGHLHTFKKGAFRMAQDLDLPVLPVSIAGSGQILPAGTLNVTRHPVRLIIHPPLPQPGTEDSDQQLLEQSHRIIAASLPE